jgi:opacity protein-like surface antigen
MKMKRKLLTAAFIVCLTSFASAQAKVGEVKSTSGASSTSISTAPAQTPPSVNNNNRQSGGSGHIDVSKAPPTKPLPTPATKQ